MPGTGSSCPVRQSTSGIRFESLSVTRDRLRALHVIFLSSSFLLSQINNLYLFRLHRYILAVEGGFLKSFHFSLSGSGNGLGLSFCRVVVTVQNRRGLDPKDAFHDERATYWSGSFKILFARQTVLRVALLISERARCLGCIDSVAGHQQIYRSPTGCTFDRLILNYDFGSYRIFSFKYSCP